MVICILPVFKGNLKIFSKLSYVGQKAGTLSVTKKVRGITDHHLTVFGSIDPQLIAIRNNDLPFRFFILPPHLSRMFDKEFPCRGVRNIHGFQDGGLQKPRRKPRHLITFLDATQYLIQPRGRHRRLRPRVLRRHLSANKGRTYGRIKKDQPYDDA